ncbi:Trm112 family protein [candidate division KSB1 bacterium]
MLSQELLNILACPKCKGEITKEDGSIEQIDLDYDKEKNTLTCNNCRLIYRIEDDIPVMLIDEAESF